METNPISSDIFVIDDNEINRIVVKEMLSQYNLNIIFAKNGREALKAATTCELQFFLMDLNMPIMDGYEATTKIRKAGINTPIVALSAAVLAEEVERALHAGVDQHLAKPIDRKELIKVLRKYL
ncbi:response regulator [Alteromonas ponticola]|uniref:Response regulator n=1 Tax=Alteromonas aquimaris TaxID=2998417 RepID=A0ABT3PA29_9ALTE|nr:response regulator [Alteromonas aquimaris]MCW8109630.1 response regulator [Alteromonas aquimaris]